jgi:toxin CptA
MRYPRTIDLSPSLLYSLLPGAAIHLVAAFAFLSLFRQPLWLLVGLSVVVVSAVASALSWRRRQGEVAELGDDGRLLVSLGGVEQEAAIVAVTDFGWARWVTWREEGARRTRARMLLRGDFASDQWRALGVWLRHKAPVGGDDPFNVA